MAKTPTTVSGRVRIKFCGLRRAQDAQQAVALGVDALGFVLVPRSKRYIAPEAAARIRATLPPFVSVVALFQDADAAEVQQGIDLLRPDLLQFHGEEAPGYCESFGLPYLKAVPMADSQDLARWARRYRSARALLLDGHAPGQMGGSGQAFNWARVSADIGKPLVLAGGLNPANVARGIRALRPYAVDVSSGIEQRPGVKDPALMQAFVAAVRRVK